MKSLLYCIIIFLSIQVIAQTTYTASWKLEYNLPFSFEKYTDVAFQLNEEIYPLGRFKGKYIPIDSKHPFFKRLPENAFTALKEMTNDTAKVIYACKEKGQISLYEYEPQKDLKDAKTLKTIVLQNNQVSELSEKNIEIQWQFEEFTQNNVPHTNIIIIINKKPYKVGIYEGKCNLLESTEHQKYKLPTNIHSAVQIKQIIIAITLSEKECIVYEKYPDQDLKTIKTFTL